MNGFAVFDSETQIAVVRDFFEGLDGLPHIAPLGLRLKVSVDLPQTGRTHLLRDVEPLGENAFGPINLSREYKTLPPVAGTDHR